MKSSLIGDDFTGLYEYHVRTVKPISSQYPTALSSIQAQQNRHLHLSFMHTPMNFEQVGRPYRLYYVVGVRPAQEVGRTICGRNHVTKTHSSLIVNSDLSWLNEKSLKETLCIGGHLYLRGIDAGLSFPERCAGASNGRQA